MSSEYTAEVEGKFSGRRYISLESYKKKGTAKQTPVQSIGEGRYVYVRTDPKTWKVKRIQANPHVRLAECDRRGRVTGSWVDGEARLLEGPERTRAIEFFKREYGRVGNLLVGLVGGLRGESLTAVIAIRLTPQLESAERTGVKAP